MPLPRPTLLAATTAATVLVGGATLAAALLENFDTNGDGRLTQAEIDAVRRDRLTRFDGDGRLAFAEYQALWADAMRRSMVRQFQANDTDGDGGVTAEEFTERYEEVVVDLERNGDGELTRDELRPPRGRGGRRGPSPHGPGGPDGPGGPGGPPDGD